MTTLTNVGEEHTVNWLIGAPSSSPTLPYKIRLLTANGTETAAGTEVSGGSYPAAGKQVAFGAAALAGDGKFESGNTVLIRFDNMPAGTIVAAELWDSASTPKRWFYGLLAESRALSAGDPVEFAAGTIKIRVE